MKTIIVAAGILLILLFTNFEANSQRVIPGITAGASLNNIDLDVDDFTTDMSDVNGVEAGLYLSFTAAGWYVRPMAVASFLRGTVTSRADGIQLDETKFSLTTLETPLLIGLKLLPGIAIEAGPSWNYLMSYTEKVNNLNLDLTRHSLGYRGGIRVSFARLGAFGHYGGIINSDDNTKYDLDRPSRIVFGVTFDLISAN
jgi:hypothetical protein